MVSASNLNLNLSDCDADFKSADIRRPYAIISPWNSTDLAKRLGSRT